MSVNLLQIETHKLDFKEKAEAKIGSRDNRRQVPYKIALQFSDILILYSV